MTKPFCTLALLSLLAAAAPVVAQPADTVTAAVQYDDLDLASSAGRATFKGRVKAAADRICGAVPVAPLREHVPVAACRAALFQSAETGIALALAPAPAEPRGTT